MKSHWIAMFFVLALSICSCSEGAFSDDGGSGSDAGVDADGGADVDADGGADVDGDGDVNADGDTDTDTDTEVEIPACIASPEAPGVQTQWIWENPTLQENILEAIWFNGSDLWMAGEGSTVVKREGLTFVWEKNAVEDNWLGGMPALANRYQDIWGTAVNDIWLLDDEDLFRWDGSSWTVVADYMFGSPEAMVGCGVSDLWVADQDTAVHWDGAAWTEYPYAANGGYFFDMACVATDDVWAVGRDGVVQRWTGSA